MATHKTTKGKARLLHQALSQIEADFFSDKSKFSVSKDDMMKVVKLASVVAPVSEEYNKLIDIHKKFFLKDAGVSSKSASQLTEEGNRLLMSNMSTYFTLDERAQKDIDDFNSSEYTIKAEYLLTGLSDALLPHDIRNAIKDFIQ